MMTYIICILQHRKYYEYYQLKKNGMGGEGNIGHMEKKCKENMLGSLKVRQNSKEPDENGRKILRSVGGRFFIGFIWLRIGTTNTLC
jgi:hypothetical protein